MSFQSNKSLFFTVSSVADFHRRYSVENVLSRDTKLVKKYFSFSRKTDIAFGMIFAVLSLTIDFISFKFMINLKKNKNKRSWLNIKL
jgi:hypothetical protein